MGAFLRWFPVALPVACLWYLQSLAWEGPEYTHHSGASLIFPKIWFGIALWVASTKRHRILAANLRKLTAPVVLAAAGFGALMAILSSLSYASPSWILLYLLCLHVSLAGELPRMRFAALAATLVVSVVVTEGFVLLLRSRPPGELPAPLAAVHEALYHKDWTIIQFDEDCARYDPELLYTLSPGTCEFTNVEFNTTVHVNALGVRDDGESLVGPEVIVTGDSHAMGWGVEQHETYAQLLERLTEKKVLNTAVSSYATARQLSLIERADLSQLEYLLIQHCANDFWENKEFAEQRELPAPSRDHFDAQVAQLEQGQRYYPGRYVTWFVSDAASRALRSMSLAPPAPKPPAGLDPRKEVENLLDVLEHHPVDLSGVDIILFEINEAAYYREWLAPMLREVVAERRGRRHMDRIQVVDIQSILDADDYFPIDGHMMPSAHEKAARRLAELIG